MPILRSSKKQLRQNEKHRIRNDHSRSLFREVRVQFDRFIAARNTKEATALFPRLQKVIDTLAKKNIIHKNNAARKKSLFAHKLDQISK